MFPLRSLPVHVAFVGGGEVLFNRFCRTGQAVCMCPCVWLAGQGRAGKGRAGQNRAQHGSGERLSIARKRPNCSNPARGASDRWMMTMFRSAGAGGPGAQMQKF